MTPNEKMVVNAFIRESEGNLSEKEAYDLYLKYKDQCVTVSMVKEKEVTLFLPKAIDFITN